MFPENACTEPPNSITQVSSEKKGLFRSKKGLLDKYSLLWELDKEAIMVYHGKTEFKGLHKNDILAPSEFQKDEFNIQAISDIYPEYYILRINQFDDIAKNTLDEWIYFLKNEEIESSFKAKGLDEAKSTLNVLKLNCKRDGSMREK